MRVIVSKMVLIVGLLVATAGAAQTFPAKPVRFIVSYPPGGGADIMARLVAQKAAEGLGQSVVVENRAGGGGTIGAAAVAKAEPDGYTVLAGGNPEITLMPQMLAKPSYGPRELAPLVLAASAPPLVVIHPATQPADMKGLFESARQRPLPYGTPGPGTPMHLAMELVNRVAQTQFLHVPYKGGGPVTADLVAGQIGMAIVNAPPLMPHLRAGKIRAVAVLQAERSSLFPEVPTFREATGMDNVFAGAWFGFLSPAGVPAPVRQRLESEILRALADAGVRQKLTEAGMDLQALPSERFARVIADETAYVRQAIERTGVRPN